MNSGCHFISLLHEYDLAKITRKNGVLGKFFSNNLSPFVITGTEELALILSINQLSSPIDHSPLSKEHAELAVRNPLFWKAVEYAITGWITHNVKMFDSRNQGYIYVGNEVVKQKNNVDNLFHISSINLKRGRTRGYAFNSSALKTRKCLFNEFIFNSRKICLADDLIDSGELTGLLIEMGANEDSIERIQKLLADHCSQLFPDTAVEPQLLIPTPDSKSGYVSTTPVSSHHMQSALHQRLGDKDNRHVHTRLSIGNGPNVGTFGDLVADCHGSLRILKGVVKTNFTFSQLCLWQLLRDHHLFFRTTHRLTLPDPRIFERNETHDQACYQNLNDKQMIINTIQSEIKHLFNKLIRLKQYLTKTPHAIKHYQQTFESHEKPPISLGLLFQFFSPSSHFYCFFNQNKWKQEFYKEAWLFWQQKRLQLYFNKNLPEPYIRVLQDHFMNYVTQYIMTEF